MGNDLGVRCCMEAMTLGYKLAPEFPMVFNDAVVHDNEISTAIAMRMGILFARSPVGRPTRVSYSAHRAFRADRDRLKLVRQALNAANCLHDLWRSSIHHGDAAGVVAAVLQSPQAIAQKRRNVTLSNIANDAAHRSSYRERSWSSIFLRISAAH